MSNKKVLLLALLFGLLTALAVNYYLKSIKEAMTNIKFQKVVTASSLIPAKTLVTSDMVSLIDMPVDYIHKDAATNLAQVVGNSTRVEIDAGEQVLQAKLVPKGSTGLTMAYAIPLGMRAISISVDQQSGLIGLIAPGDRVDIIGTLDIEEQSRDPNVNSIKHSVTHLMLQNTEVLAVGKNYIDPNTQTGLKDKELSNNTEKSGTSTVTLAVPASQMQFLVAINDKGKITLALRPPTDNSEEDRPAIDSLQLLK